MADTLLILLPGALMTPQHYRDAGFVDTVAAQRPDIELQLATVDVDQLDIAASVDALHRQVIAPARARGHRRLLLGGISLGGAVALHYARQHGEQIDGLCLLAPYPGSRLTSRAIQAAGGLAPWRAASEPSLDAEVQLWHWLADGQAALPTYLGYGRDDRFADGMALLATALPAARVHIVEGGHDWPAWCALWQDFLANGLPGMSANSKPLRPPIKSAAGSERDEGRDTERKASTRSARSNLER